MPRRPETRDSLLVGLGSLLLYAVLYRERLHYPDAKDFLCQVHEGYVVNHHFLYLRLSVAAHWLLAPLGCSVFVSTLALSVLGGCAAVVAAHRTMLALGLARTKAHLAAWLVATTPALFFYATTIEIHAPFLAVANVAWWSAAAACRDGARPGVAAGVRTGFLTALAAGVHATGQLLVWPLLLLFWRAGRSLSASAALVVAHALVVSLLAVGVTGGTQYLSSAGGVLGDGLSAVFGNSLALRVLWHEWLLAFAPLSFLALGALATSRHRRLALFVHASLLPYVVTCVALLRGPIEYGAYLLPMAVLFAWLAARALPVVGMMLCIVVSLAIGLGQAMPLRQDPWEAAFAADVRALNREAPMWLMTASLDEVSALAREATEVSTTAVSVTLPARGMGAESLPMLCQGWDQGFAANEAQGRRLVLTRSALEYLRDPDGGVLARMMADVDRRYSWHPVQRGTFHGFEARRK